MMCENQTTVQGLLRHILAYITRTLEALVVMKCVEANQDTIRKRDRKADISKANA